MRNRPSLKRFVSLTLAGLMSSATLAIAAPPRRTPVAPAPPPDPAIEAHKQFVLALKDGSAKYEAKDIPGAIEQFQKASLLEPRNPLGYYMLGDAQFGNNDLPQAESAWLHASQVSDEGSPALKAKIFFVVAELRERQKRWEDAKAAWGQYTDLTAKFAEGTAFPQVASQRIAAIDEMLKQDKAYEIVRTRIKEDKSKAGVPVLPAPTAH